MKIPHLIYSRMRIVVWCDAIGLALFSVTEAQISFDINPSSAITIAMDVTTATFGGVILDLSGDEMPALLHREIYLTAAMLGTTVLVIAETLGTPREAALVIGFLAALAIRAAAIRFELSLTAFYQHFKTTNNRLGSSFISPSCRRTVLPISCHI